MGDVSELTLVLLRVLFLVVLWAFVFIVIYAVRSDLFGGPVRRLDDKAGKRERAVPFTTEAQPTLQPVAAGSDAPTEQVALGGTGGAGAASAPHPSWRPGTPATGDVRLVVTSGPKAGQEIALGRDPLTIGRSPDSGLVIRDEYTSTHHARLMRWQDQWMLQDLDSTNGTFLDGSRVTVPTPVDLGASIRVGTTTFELRA